jgi:NTP pyrophosphatase (non-canonical NTP hydrolase)
MWSTAAVADLAQLHRQIDEFLAARDWHRYHTPKNLAMALTGEVGELVEILQWLTPEEAERAGSDPELRPRLEDELADVLIYLASLAKVLDVDLIDAALAKVARNEHRFATGE